tara:strand:- start:5343 stop:6101 length:759 start_codon:yes stop_codon:yes gene_type:complete
MIKRRIISRIDIKNEYVIKGIQLEGLRKVGMPNDMALKYYNEGIDEIIFMDAVASYYDRNSLSKIIDIATNNIFVPITVGGGIRNINDINTLLKIGADKVAINTAAVKNPLFIKKASKIFGSQCIVSSIEAKKIDKEKWYVYFDNGREATNIDVIDWAKEVQKMGAGEILITSIDNEGTKKGFDYELNKSVSESVSIPVISSGGASSSGDILKLFNSTEVEAVALASILHFNLNSINSIKRSLLANKVNIRI